MKTKAKKRPRTTLLLLAIAIATFAALAICEISLRLLLAPSTTLGALGYADAQGNPISGAPEAIRKGLIVAVKAKKPRQRTMFTAGKNFYLTYEDNDKLQRPWLDDQGRVINRINRFGLRERADITPTKPSGERRILCLGDSFTFGWGIPVEQVWVRMLENELRQDGSPIRTVNCGAAGTVCVDEYVAGLKHRFHVFKPDAVIMTLCLNDLIPSSGLTFAVPVVPSSLRIIDLAKAALGYGPLNLDPSRDWVQELIDLPQDEGEAGMLYNQDRPFESMWSQGVPQKSMREAKAWCDARKIPFMVILWPFMQGLGKGRYYPFQKLHNLVASDCEAAGIPFLDVLPALETTNHEELWVTPADPHPNPTAQRLVMPMISKFVRSQIGG
jgi:hypothetical protein